MSYTLNRRLAKVEDALLPSPEKSCTLLFEPSAETATSDDWQAHQQRIDDALARDSKPVILAFVKPRPMSDA